MHFDLKEQQGVDFLTGGRIVIDYGLHPHIGQKWQSKDNIF